MCSNDSEMTIARRMVSDGLTVVFDCFKLLSDLFSDLLGDLTSKSRKEPKL